jgi:hypothetical protein
MWDVYLAFIILLTIVQLNIEKTRIVTSIFIGLEADILFRIFLFVPLRTYHIFYGFTVDTMRLIWVSGALMTPIQVCLSILFTMILYTPIKKILKDLKGASTS